LIDSRVERCTALAIVMLPMHFLRAKHQVVEGQLEQGGEGRDGPARSGRS
jgi:hypothetical protein